MPHIFSHKGGLVQDEGALPYAPFAPPAPPPAWQRRIWQTSPGTRLCKICYQFQKISYIYNYLQVYSHASLAGGGNEWGGWRTAASDWGDGDSRGWQPPPPLDTVTIFNFCIKSCSFANYKRVNYILFNILLLHSHRRKPSRVQR